MSVRKSRSGEVCVTRDVRLVSSNSWICCSRWDSRVGKACCNWRVVKDRQSERDRLRQRCWFLRWRQCVGQSGGQCQL